jgi:hypothetical protein
MNFFTQILHLLAAGATAYISARNLRDAKTRPDILAGLQLAESGSVPFLMALRDRAVAEGDSWLAAKLARHAEDERRHGQILAHALKLLNKKVIDFKNLSEAAPENGKPNERRQSPFFAAYFDGYPSASLSPQQIDWTVFMASTYILELDASQDFIRMANALPEHEQPCITIKQGLLSIAKDETDHAAYLYEALQRRMPYPAVLEVVDVWRTRKVNALLAMVSNLIQKEGQMPSLTQDSLPREMSSSRKSEISERVKVQEAWKA